MVKVKGKKKQQAPKKVQPRRRRINPVQRAKVGMGMVKEICSITNPFCPEAVGARWPDNSYTKSVGWSLTNYPMTISTDNNGQGAILYLPEGGYMDPTSITGAGVTYADLQYFVSTWPAEVARFRVTSWGLRVNCATSAMLTTGTLRVRLFSPMFGASLISTSLTSNLADASFDIPLSRLINEDLTIIPAPLGDNARYFQVPRNYGAPVSTNWTNIGWQVVQIGIDGGIPNAGAINVQVFYNFEFAFNDASSSTAFAQPPPASNPTARIVNAGVIEDIGNFLEGSLDKLERLYESKTARLAGRIATAAYTRNPALLLGG